MVWKSASCSEISEIILRLRRILIFIKHAILLIEVELSVLISIRRIIYEGSRAEMSLLKLLVGCSKSSLCSGRDIIIWIIASFRKRRLKITRIRFPPGAVIIH